MTRTEWELWSYENCNTSSESGSGWPFTSPGRAEPRKSQSRRVLKEQWQRRPVCQEEPGLWRCKWNGEWEWDMGGDQGLSVCICIRRQSKHNLGHSPHSRHPPPVRQGTPLRKIKGSPESTSWGTSAPPWKKPFRRVSWSPYSSVQKYNQPIYNRTHAWRTPSQPSNCHFLQYKWTTWSPYFREKPRASQKKTRQTD